MTDMDFSQKGLKKICNDAAGLISQLLRNERALPASRGTSEKEHLTLMTFTNLDGTGGYLDLVQFPHCAVAIDEVG